MQTYFYKKKKSTKILEFGGYVIGFFLAHSQKVVTRMCIWKRTNQELSKNWLVTISIIVGLSMSYLRRWRTLPIKMSLFNLLCRHLRQVRRRLLHRYKLCFLLEVRLRLRLSRLSHLERVFVDVVDVQKRRVT